MLIGNTRAKIRSEFEKEMKKRNINLKILDAESLEEAVKIASGNSKLGMLSLCPQPVQVLICIKILKLEAWPLKKL